MENATIAKEYAKRVYKELDNFTAFISMDEFVENEEAIRAVQTMLHRHF